MSRDYHSYFSPAFRIRELEGRNRNTFLVGPKLRSLRTPLLALLALFYVVLVVLRLCSFCRILVGGQEEVEERSSVEEFVRLLKFGLMID